MGLIFSSAQITQPQVAVPLSSRYPRPERVYVPGVGDLLRKSQFGSGVNACVRAGRSYYVADAIDAYVQLDNVTSNLAASEFSILVLMQYGDTLGSGQGVGNRVGPGPLADRSTFYLGIAGSVLFDFGGATDGTTRITGTVPTSAGTIACYVATTGALGMRLYSNGVLLASNASNPTAGRSIDYNFVVGDCYGGNSGNAYYALVVPWNTRLSDVQARDLSENPWKLFQPPNDEIWVQSAGGTTITCSVGNATSTGVSALSNTSIACSVAATSATGVNAFINRSLVCSVGATSATGVSALLNTSTVCAVGNANAAGVSAQVTRSIVCSVGNTSATGVSALLNLSDVCNVGNAAATGINASIGFGSNITITCSVGSTAATGVNAQISPSVVCSVGATSATGVSAQVSRSIVCAVGATAATGVNAQISLSDVCTVGNASATGVNCTITIPGNQTITCTVGNTTSAGVNALMSVGVSCSVANVIAAGVSALIGKVVVASVGNAAASGVTSSIVVSGNSIVTCTVGISSATGVTATINGFGGVVSDPEYIIHQGYRSFKVSEASRPFKISERQRTFRITS